MQLYTSPTTPFGRKVMVQIRESGLADRVEEIARMLGGAEITDTTKRHARELLGN